MKKLLTRTVKPLAVYALVVLALSIPAYYFIVDFIWVRELDKHHYALRQKMESRINGLHLSDATFQQTIAIWNEIEPGYVISPVSDKVPGRDSTYSVIRFDQFMQDREQFRCLVTHVSINGKLYRLKIETNMEERDETVAAIALVAIVFFLLLIAGFILLIRRLSIRLWHPFYHTLDQLKAFSLENERNLTFEPSPIQEFTELNNSLDQLIADNIEAYRQQKEFAENASHELQTPLAILQSQLDLLWQSDSLTEEQSAGIAGAGKALSRVSRINKNLLLLARIENHQFADRETIDLGQLTAALTNALAEHSPDLPLCIRQDIQPGISIQGNPVLMEILLNNLLINTIRHSTGTGNIEVLLSAGQLVVSNPGLQSLHQDKLFKRFISASAQTPGSGLGLAIVKQTCDRYGWRISYRFEQHRHYFMLDF